MKQSLRARRMERIHRRTKRGGNLNLISLMDIFTILVFFLLVNSSEVEVLQTNKTIKLPESTAEQQPDNALVVMVNESSILVENRKVADTAAFASDKVRTIEPLRQELEYRASRRPFANDAERQLGRNITIMGHREIPYSLLKKIMATLAETEYRNISLAVTRVPTAEPTGNTNVQLDQLPAAGG